MDNLKLCIDKNSLVSIFPKTNKKLYLYEYLSRMMQLGTDVIGVEIASGKHKGCLKFPNPEEQAVRTWDFNVSCRVLRDMYRETDKYKDHAAAYQKYQEHLDEWNRRKLGQLHWSCSPSSLDRYIICLARDKTLTPAQKYSRAEAELPLLVLIRAINQYRNDYIEYLVFEANECLIPCFCNRKGRDYYYWGWRDQKISRLPKKFIEEYGDDWQQYVEMHPEVLAKYFYTHQDRVRFGSESRVYLIVDDDADISMLDFTLPSESVVIDFEYDNKRYRNVECFVKLVKNYSHLP